MSKGESLWAHHPNLLEFAQSSVVSSENGQKEEVEEELGLCLWVPVAVGLPIVIIFLVTISSPGSTSVPEELTNSTSVDSAT